MTPFVLRDRMWKVTKEANGCWVWTGAKDKNGYGNVWVAEWRKNHRAHRVFYIALRGQIGEGLELDHLCRNPSCVNPDHLEPVTHRENQRRGWSATKTHCKNGHLFDEENTYDRSRQRKGLRVCRACNRESKARSRAANERLAAA